MKSKKIAIEQDNDAPVAATVLESSIVAIKKAAEQLLNSGLTRDAIAILIHHNMPTARRISQRDIVAVLDAAASLDNFVTKKPAPAESP